jgi:acyl carrier protein
MNKQEFFKELEDLFEIDEELNDISEFDLDSMDILSLVVFLDENFSIQKTAKELTDVSSIKDIIEIVGQEVLL